MFLFLLNILGCEAVIGYRHCSSYAFVSQQTCLTSQTLLLSGFSFNCESKVQRDFPFFINTLCLHISHGYS